MIAFAPALITRDRVPVRVKLDRAQSHVVRGDEERPDRVAVVFDISKETFRHERYPAYKATRDAQPEELSQQIPLARELAAAWRIPLLEVPGWEAEVTVEELREGGQNLFVHRLPNGAKYGNLVLKRGMLDDSEVADWCRDGIENFSFDPKNVTVYLLNDDHDPLATWHFLKAWPVKWSVSDFKAQDNALVIESLELAYRRFRKG